MKTTVVNIYRDKGQVDVRIMRGTYKRPSKWGNPVRLETPRTPEREARCLFGHARHLRDTGLVDDVHELRGKALGCCCAPARCHGDTLARLADSDNPHEELGLIIEELEQELVEHVKTRTAQTSLFGGAS